MPITKVTLPPPKDNPSPCVLPQKTFLSFTYLLGTFITLSLLVNRRPANHFL